MGRVKSEMFEDDLGPDDELIPKRNKIVDEIRDCDLPHGTFERQAFLNDKIKELMNAINCK